MTHPSVRHPPHIDPIEVAAIDITTAHGVDSIFSGGLRDPWAEVSLANFIDVVVNHSRVLLPLPSEEALAELDAMPKSVRAAWNCKLLRFVKSEFATSVPLPEAVLHKEYQRFREWCHRSPAQIGDWLYFQRNTPAILKQSSRQVTPSVASYWPRKPKDRLETFIDVSPGDLRYAFDVFARTIQYHIILRKNQAFYFRHPFRDHALAVGRPLSHLRSPSWGEAFIAGMAQGYLPMKIEKLLAYTARIRDDNLSTTWYHMAAEPLSRRIEAMHDVAAKAKLPAKFRDSVLRTFRVSLGLAGPVVAAWGDRTIGIVLLSSLALLREWKGKVPAAVRGLRILRGSIERPYLPRIQV